VIEKCRSLGTSKQKYGFLSADMGKVEDRGKVIQVEHDNFL